MNRHPENENKNGIQVWYCRDCNQVHLRATNVMLDFTKQEFLGLSNAVLGILHCEFPPETLREMPNYHANTDDVLLADLIA